MKFGKLALLTVVAGVACSTAFAQVFGPSNIGFMGYPDPTCREPYKPFSGASEYTWRSFQDDVDRYIDCINEYVEAGDNDVKRIRQAQEEALSDGKRFLASIR